MAGFRRTNTASRSYRSIRTAENRRTGWTAITCSSTTGRRTRRLPVVGRLAWEGERGGAHACVAGSKRRGVGALGRRRGGGRTCQSELSRAGVSFAICWPAGSGSAPRRWDRTRVSFGACPSAQTVEPSVAIRAALRRTIVGDWRGTCAIARCCGGLLETGGRLPEGESAAVPVFYDAVGGRFHAESWVSVGGAAGWLPVTVGHVQERWPRMLVDRCPELAENGRAPVNERQTEMSYEALQAQDPEAPVRAHAGSELRGPGAWGRGWMRLERAVSSGDGGFVLAELLAVRAPTLSAEEMKGFLARRDGEVLVHNDGSRHVLVLRGAGDELWRLARDDSVAHVGRLTLGGDEIVLELRGLEARGALGGGFRAAAASDGRALCGDAPGRLAGVAAGAGGAALPWRGACGVPVRERRYGGGRHDPRRRGRCGVAVVGRRPSDPGGGIRAAGAVPVGAAGRARRLAGGARPMIVRVLLAWGVAAVALSASGEGGAQQEGSRIEPLPGLETWDGMGDGALAGSSAEQDEAAAEEAAPADVGDAETEVARRKSAPRTRRRHSWTASPGGTGAGDGGCGRGRRERRGGAGEPARWRARSLSKRIPVTVRARPAFPGLGDRRDAAAAEAAAGAGMEDSVPVPPSGTEGRGTVPALLGSVPSLPVTEEPPARGSLWRLLDERADRAAGESAAAFVADMAREGCPRDLIGRLLAGAVDERDGLTALALEREILVLCRKRQEAVSAVLEQEAVLRELAARPRVEPAPGRDRRSGGLGGGDRCGAGARAGGGRGRGAAVRGGGRGGRRRKGAPEPEPAGPAYRWFTLAGSGGDLRAGVTDGTGVWFVRAGDGLPGGVWVTGDRGGPAGRARRGCGRTAPCRGGRRREVAGMVGERRGAQGRREGLGAGRADRARAHGCPVPADLRGVRRRAVRDRAGVRGGSGVARAASRSAAVGGGPGAACREQRVDGSDRGLLGRRAGRVRGKERSRARAFG